MKTLKTCFKFTFLIFLFYLPFYISPQPIDMNAANAQSEFMWGVNAFHNGYLGKSIQSFEEALRLTPKDPLLKTWLGRAYFRLGYEETALSIWKEIMSTYARTPLLEYQINIVELRRGLGRELSSPDIYVINQIIDSSVPPKSYFKRPSSVFCLPDGKFFIIAYGSNEILKLNANSLILDRFRGGMELLKYPFDFISAANKFYLTEFEGNQISIFDRNFVKLKSFGKKGIGDGQLLGPQYLALDEQQYLYVSDWGNRRICKFDLEGNFILSFGKNRNLYPFEKLYPTGLVVKSSKLYVADQFKSQIVVFDLNGNYLDRFGEGVLKNPEGLIFYDDNILLVADQKKILAYSLKDQVWKVWADLEAQAERLTGIRLTPNGDILASDFDGNKVFLLSEADSLVKGFFVQILRIDSRNFPDITLDVAVEDFLGKPLVGLTTQNFYLTENNKPVSKLNVAVANTDGQPLSILVVVEDSPKLDGYNKELMIALENLISVFGKKSRLKIVFAREQPNLEADFGMFDLKKLQALIKLPGKANWKFDSGIRSVLTELAGERGRKAVIFLCSGDLKNTNYALHNLSEVASSLRNNGIRFYPVYFGSLNKQADYEYLVKETGGQSYNFFNAEGLLKLFEEIDKALGANYVLRYLSPTNSEFGRRYIPVEMQVVFYKRTGRDESGYYGPLVTK